MSNLRATLRVLCLIGLIAWTFPFVLTVWLLRLEKICSRLVQAFFDAAGYICGLRIKRRGAKFSKERPLMLVSNHTSYLDVFAIGGLLRVSFTPKREVRSWPVIGFLCVLADCVFVERRPTEMKAAAAEMNKRLSKGKVLCLFPEGTTSDGYHIKAFKSGFLSLAETHNMPVQPVSIAYTHIGRERVTEVRREEVAWVGDATFFGHFWHVLGLPNIHIEMIVHKAQHIKDFPDRKSLTQSCQQVIVADVKRMLGNQ